MKMLKVLFILLFAIYSNIIVADDQLLEIGIYRNLKLNSIEFKPANSTYKVYDENDSLVYHLQANEKAYVKVNKDKSVNIQVSDENLGNYLNLYILSNDFDATYSIEGLAPKTSQREYYGGLSFFSKSGNLDVVSMVSMHHYLIGVIESESGNAQGKEYYKVQAIISRTYALKNNKKFIHEGFMMTDLVNCQVYLGKMYRNPKIEQAVKETKDLVLVDNDMKYISAAFYANSGGQTANSEDVWTKEVSYLRSIKDPFSKGSISYYWIKRFSEKEFISKLKEFYNFPINDKKALQEALSWGQVHRAKYFVDWKYHILLTDFRRDFGLKSTFFSLALEDGDVVVKGRGFGHGVGLSQQGAMRMCDMGYGFKDVLFFYYTDVHLIDLNLRSFYLSD